MTSSQPILGPGNQLDHYYPPVSPDAEVLNRPVKGNTLRGQGAFFKLITDLNVPVLENSSNPFGGQDFMFVGAGRSYGVTQSLFTLQNHATIRSGPGVSGRIENSLATRRYVTKRVTAATSQAVADDQQLAAITNEVRILANENLRKADNLVKLICVAWDEIPSHGRYWPRLLLECADYGNLGAFLALSKEVHDWDVKLSLLLDVLGGLKMLHNHEVAHCDLKLENVLVFECAEELTPGVKHRAKLCDFGFSVIMSDYEEGAPFSARLGTDPWNAPELAFGIEIKIDDLPQSDIYSFGLLLSRVFMNGGDPFEGMTMDEINELKRGIDGSNLSLYDEVRLAIFAKVEYSDSQQLLVQKILLVTTRQKPEHRFPIDLIGTELIILGAMVRE